MSLLSRTLLAPLALVVCCFGAATAARAGTITITNLDTGWYNDQGFHDASNQNNLAGSVTVGTTSTTFHNYFVFDLSGVSGTVTSAQLRLFTSGVTGSGPYTLFDVSTPVSVLSASQTNRTDVFADLGSGVVYGSTTITPAADGSIITIDLNTVALAALQSQSGSLFAVGGLFETATGTFAFGGSRADLPDPRNQLILQTQPSVPTPEPATLLLLGMGLAGVGMRLRGRLRESQSRS